MNWTTWKLVPGEGGDEDAQVDRDDCDDEQQHEDLPQGALVLDSQGEDRVEEYYQGLYTREQQESEQVAGEDVRPADGGGQEPLEGTLRSLAQEAHAGEEEDEEEGEYADQARGDAVQDVALVREGEPDQGHHDDRGDDDQRD